MRLHRRRRHFSTGQEPRRAAPSHGVFIASRVQRTADFFSKPLWSSAGARDTHSLGPPPPLMPLPTGIETPAKGPSVSYAQQVAEAKGKG